MSGSQLSPGQLVHRLLRILATDFYRPFRPAYLSSQLFPGEYFNPRTSIDRVHKALRRLRQWLKAHRVPLEVSEEEGCYRLRSSKPLVLRTTLEPIPATGLEGLFQLLEKSVAMDLVLSALEMEKRLGVSRATVHRLIQWGMESSKLEAIGSGSAVRYKRT
jgi:hypothetical protein